VAATDPLEGLTPAPAEDDSADEDLPLWAILAGAAALAALLYGGWRYRSARQT
jgi:type VI protein secretion system component VasF